jgi:hypothetical protein
MEAALGKKFVEVVARDAARNLGKAAANVVCIAIAKGFQLSIELAATTAFACDCGELGIARGSDRELRAVIEEHRELFDVVDGLAPEQ